MAATDVHDHGYDLKLSFNYILGNGRMKHEIYVESRALFDTVSTLHEPREFRLRNTVARMCDSFEFGELDALKWIVWLNKLADALKKVIPAMSASLSTMLAVGVWDEGLLKEWRI